MRFAIALALLTVSCSGGGSSTTPPPTTSPPSPAVAACSIPFETAVLSEGAASAPKSDVADDRRTRRGRVYEQLWKHQARRAPGRRSRAQPSTFGPAATTEDIGQVAVVRDEGDLVLPANRVRPAARGVAFARNGSGGYDVRRSDRAFQSAVGEKIPLGDDDSARLALPFTFPFYAGRYAEAFVNSDGNVTFVTEEHASTDRNVARFLTGPPRIAPVFDDLDPSQARRRVPADRRRCAAAHLVRRAGIRQRRPTG